MKPRDGTCVKGQASDGDIGIQIGTQTVGFDRIWYRSLIMLERENYTSKLRQKRYLIAEVAEIITSVSTRANGLNTV